MISWSEWMDGSWGRVWWDAYDAAVAKYGPGIKENPQAYAAGVQDTLVHMTQAEQALGRFNALVNDPANAKIVTVTDRKNLVALHTRYNNLAAGMFVDARTADTTDLGGGVNAVDTDNKTPIPLLYSSQKSARKEKQFEDEPPTWPWSAQRPYWMDDPYWDKQNQRIDGTSTPWSPAFKAAIRDYSARWLDEPGVKEIRGWRQRGDKRERILVVMDSYEWEGDPAVNISPATQRRIDELVRRLNRGQPERGDRQTASWFRGIPVDVMYDYNGMYPDDDAKREIGVAPLIPVLVVIGIAFVSIAAIAWAFACVALAAELHSETVLAENDLQARVDASKEGRTLQPATTVGPTTATAQGGGGDKGGYGAVIVGVLGALGAVGLVWYAARARV